MKNKKNENRTEKFKFDLSNGKGILQGYQSCAEAAMNQTVPNQNITNAVRAINGPVKIAELQLRYDQWVAKMTGIKEVRKIALLEDTKNISN